MYNRVSILLEHFTKCQSGREVRVRVRIRLGLGLTPFSGMQVQIRNFQVHTSEFLIDTQLEMNIRTLKKWQDWVSAIFIQKLPSNH